MAPTNPGNIRKKLVLMGVLLLLFANPVRAQINFGDFDDYSLTVTAIEHLDFGQVIAGYEEKISPLDVEAGLVEITGVPYLDVIVEIPNEIDLNHETESSQKITLDVEGAYANTGGMGIDDSGDPSVRTLFTGTLVRFPMRHRPAGSPPRPPPTPPHSGYAPRTVSSYVAIGGTLNAPQGASAGVYTGQITVRVEYD